MSSKVDEERQEVRCDCNRLQFVINRKGIEIKCGKCGQVRTLKWKQLLTWILDILPDEEV